MGAATRASPLAFPGAGMGNQLAAPARVQPGELLASDVPHLVYKDSLGGGRFLKTFLTRHEEGSRGGLVVVKVYLKRGAPGTGGGLDPNTVMEHERELQHVRRKLLTPPPKHLHAWPFQRELETDRAVYLIRQYAHSTLYDRVSTRPFLTLIEKKWLAFQLLHGLADCHDRNVAHGDIKTENVLVTSWGWAFLTDFATFKPKTLPADNPSDYSFFFDTGGRRRCYVAPERFKDAGPAPKREATLGEKTNETSTSSDGTGETHPEPEPKHNSSPEEPLPYDPFAADVFSLGCALGELFLDGYALFDLSQLLAYRAGGFDPSAALEKVGDQNARALVMSMIHLDPKRRPTARAHLERWKQAVTLNSGETLSTRGIETSKTPFFPKYFDRLHDFGGALMTLDADQTASAITQAFEPLLADIAREEGGFVGFGETGEKGEEAVGEKPPASQSAPPRADTDSKKTEHMMRDIDLMMADIGSLLGDGGGDGGGDGADDLPTDCVGADFVGDFVETPGAFPARSTDSAKQRSPIAVPIRASSPEDTRLIQACVDGGVTLPGAVLVASVICSCVRGAVRPSLRRDALGLLSQIAAVADDDTRLQLIVPFCVASAADGAAAVRAAAVRALASTTARVETFPASDAKVFPEFVWPSLMNLARDREESVRVAYAASLASLAGASARFLQRANENVEDTSETITANALSMRLYEHDLSSLRAVVKGVVLDYLTPGATGGGGAGGGHSPETADGNGNRGVFPSPAFVRGAADLSRAVVAAGGIAENSVMSDSATGDADSNVLEPGAGANAVGADGARRVNTSLNGANLFGPPPSTPPVPTRLPKDFVFSEQSPGGAGHASFGGSPLTGSFNAGTGAGGANANRAVRDAGPATRAAVLANADSLAVFFGRQDANDYLVPLLITCLNDRSWTLRAAFFTKIAKLGRFVGITSTEAFLLPCVERCMADDSDEVAASALHCLGDMCGADLDEERKVGGIVGGVGNDTNRTSMTHGQHEPHSHTTGATLRKRSVLAAAIRAAPALCHPSGAVRVSAARFFVAAAKRLGAADAFSLLLPLVRPFLTEKFASLGAVAAELLVDVDRLAMATRAPPSREAFDAAVVAAGGAPRSRHRRGASGASVDLTGQALETTNDSVSNHLGHLGGTDEPATADEKVTLKAMDAYINALASARRGKGLSQSPHTASAIAHTPTDTFFFIVSGAERDPNSQRSLVAGGLTPAAVAAKKADAAAVAAAAERERVQTSVLRGGLFGNPHRVFGTDRLRNGGGLRVSDVSPTNANAFSAPATSAASPVPLNKITIDDDAWAFVFAPRAPALVPPHAPLVSRRETQAQGFFTQAGNATRATHQRGADSDANGVRRRSLDVADGFGFVAANGGGSGVRRDASSGAAFGQKPNPGDSTKDPHPPPETVTKTLSVLAKVLTGETKTVAGDPTGIDSNPPRVGVSRVSTPGEYASGDAGDPWAPRGVLVAHLREHRRPCRALAASADGLFFVSGGDDGECKLWDCTRLERDVSFRARLTYASQGGKVTALLAGAGHAHAVASASDDGSVHVWRVEYVERRREGGGGESSSTQSTQSVSGPPRVERYTGAAETKQLSANEGAVAALLAVSNDTLCFATARGGVHGWDLRAPPSKEAFRIFVPPRLGAVTCAVAGPGPGPGGATGEDASTGNATWVAFGTQTGVLGLCDLRFGVVASARAHPGGAAAPVDAVAVARSRGLVGPHPGHGHGRPLVWAAAGEDEIALWDVAGGTCHRVLKVSRRRDGFGCENVADTVAALSMGGGLATAPCPTRRSDWTVGSVHHETLYQIHELKDPSPTADGARCLLSLPNGSVLSGGSDACVRLWTPGDVSRTRVVCGPLAPQERPRYEEFGVEVNAGVRSDDTHTTDHDDTPGTRVIPVLRETPASAKPSGRGRETKTQSDDVSVAETVASAAVRHDCHRDSVLAMCVTGVGTARVLVTCGRDAAVKVWK